MRMAELLICSPASQGAPLLSKVLCGFVRFHLPPIMLTAQACLPTAHEPKGRCFAGIGPRAPGLLLDRHGRTVRHVGGEIEYVLVLQADAAVTYILAYR